jgi:hypothetical protein
MKVTLKSRGLDLEVDNIEKLEDVLEFVRRFKEIEVQAHGVKLKLNIEAAKAVKSRPTKKK